MKTDLAQCFGGVASALSPLETALIEDMVAVGERGGDGAHGGLSRKRVASELVAESVGDQGLSLS